MSTKIDRNKLIKWIIGLVIIFIAEIFIFNYKYWVHIADREVQLNYEVVKGKELSDENAYKINPKKGYILINVDNLEVKSLKILITDISKSASGYIGIKVAMRDEGHELEYNVITRNLVDEVANTHWMEVSPFGKVKEIKIYIDATKKKNIRIDGIYINSHPEFVFSLARMAIMLSIYILTILAGEFSYVEFDTKRVKHRIIVSASTLAVFFLMWFVLSWVKSDDSQEYGEMAVNLTEGKAYLDIEVDEVLASMENPYDKNLRTSIGAKYKWDYAFYEGKYYVYFGVAPVILFYLPYYLITGQMLPHYNVEIILLFLISLGTSFLLRNMYLRYGKRMKLTFYLLLNVTMLAGIGSVLILKRTAVYHVAQGSGLAFTVCGLALWFGATLKENEKPNIVATMMGSLCMAIAVGCRPQYAMYSFLAFPIFWGWLGKGVKSFIKNGCLIIVPYIPIALGLMYYNYIRFGSIADFGSNYNLTSYDMVHMGLHWERIRAGIWYFFLDSPNFSFAFPYLNADAISMSYPGYIFAEKQIYGILWGLPITLVVFMYKKARKTIKESKCTVLFWLSSFISIFLAIFDVVLCGISTRYQMDLRAAMLIAAVVIVFSLGNDEMNKTLDRLYHRVFTILCLLTIIMAVLTVFSQYESPDYINRFPILYYKLNNTFGLFNY